MSFRHLDNPAGPDHRFNVGDDIQVQAAMQFTPHWDGLVPKPQLNSYSGPPAKMIMNGWFMHNPQQWPPSDQIDPLMISFHMNPAPAKAMLERGREFFRHNAPIGCRDHQTLALFQSAGIDAYYSGCLTLTLDRAAFVEDLDAPRRGILAVDLLYKLGPPSGRFGRWLTQLGLRANARDQRHRCVADLIERLVDPCDLTDVVHLRNSHPIDPDGPVQRHAIAQELLRRLASAKLVLTSRIHAALPCLAFGTPVIFVDGALDQPSERARLDGIVDLMPVLPVSADGRPDFVALSKSLAPERAAEREARLSQLRNDLTERCRAFCRVH